MKNIIHWNKFKRQWTSHTWKSCIQADVILVNGEWHTEMKPDKKTNPRGWIVTNHTNVIINPSQDLLDTFEKVKQLWYDKQDVCFSINSGNYLLFDKEGCFLIKKKEDK